MKSSLGTARGRGRMTEPPQEQRPHPGTSRPPTGPHQPGLEEDRTLRQRICFEGYVSLSLSMDNRSCKALEKKRQSGKFSNIQIIVIK